MRYLQRLPCFLAGSLVALATHAQSPGEVVTPKQAFTNALLNIYSPDSDGWVVTGAGGNGIAFGKRGSEANETYGAQVVTLELPPTSTGEELVGVVKNRIAAMNPAPRFQEADTSFQFTEERGYPCVNVRAEFDDTAAANSSGKQTLRLKVVALDCRHPAEPDTGFFAAFSYRGTRVDTQIDEAGKSFIESIRPPT